MPVSLAEILTPEDRDSVLETLLAVAASLSAPTTSWQEGAPILTLLTTASQKLADLTVVAVEIAKGGFGDLLPSDEWADIWALSRFNVTRIAATQASGLVDLTNTSLSNYTLAIGELIVAHAVTGKTYRNTTAITILATVGLANVPIAADEPGTESNAAPGTITTVVSTLVGVGCTNPLSFVGTDKETTPALVTRARAKLGALSPNGPKDAYNYVATTPELSPGLSTPITRTRTIANELTGEVSVYLATSSGAPIAGDVAIVQAAIDTYAEPWGVTATAIAATPNVIAVTYQAWITGSQLTAAQIQTAIGTALAEWFSTLDLGGYVIPPDTGAVYVDALEQVIGQATPGILRVIVSVPAADVALTPNEVAVLGVITPTITIL
jgi:hypothetical protein